MGFFDLFKSGKKKELSQIRNLIAVALADGRMQQEEMEAIMAICTRDNISVDIVKQCIDTPKSIPFIVPNTMKEKICHLRDLVTIMIIDGDIDKKELAVCKICAIKLGFKHEVIDAIIMDIINQVKNNI